MAPSWVSTSISMFLKSQKAFLLALEPLRQISAHLSKAKDVLALIQEIVLIIIIIIIIIIVIIIIIIIIFITYIALTVH